MEVCGFSENASRLAVGELDGRIKFVDCGTSEITQEFTPSGHLSAACSCVAWQPADFVDTHTKRRSTAPNRLVAFGCVNGSILIYDSAKSEVVGRLEGGHSDRVTCVRWHPSRRNTLFSGGQDSHVAEWNTSKFALRNRWKADRHAVFAISLFETPIATKKNGHDNGLDGFEETGKVGANGLATDSHTTLWLVSASRTIKVWNVLTQQCVAVLSAHTTEVHFLRIAEFGGPAVTQHDYLLFSASKQERVGCVWRLNAARLEESNSSSKKKQIVVQPVGYLKADSDTRSLACIRLGDAALVAVTTQTGELFIYEFDSEAKMDINSAQQREPTKSVRIGTTRKSSARFNQFAIVSCTLTAIGDAGQHAGFDAGNGVQLTIAYRTRLAYAVETVSYKELRSGANILEREERVAQTSVGSASLRVVTRDATVTQALSTAAARKVREPLIGNAARYINEAEAERFKLDASAVSVTPPASTPSSASEPVEDRSKGAADVEPVATGEPTLGDRLLNRKRKAPNGETQNDIGAGVNANLEADAFKKRKVDAVNVETTQNDVNSGANTLGGDSVLTVLIQGLQSGDEKLLDSVFRPMRTAVAIRRTVELLPPAHLGSLVRELLKRVQDVSQRMELVMRWIRATISAHAAQFAFQPAAMRTLCNMRQLFEARMRTFSELLSLNGKLELVLDQVDRQCSAATTQCNAQPQRNRKRNSRELPQLVVFRDEDSDSDDDSADRDSVVDELALSSHELFDEDEFERIAQQTSSQEETDDDDGDDDDNTGDDEEGLEDDAESDE